MRGLVLVSVVVALATAPAHAQTPDGQKLVQSRCGACHALDKAQNRVGPYLVGVVGRKAASIDGFHYSKALQDSGLVWDHATLDEFLAKPQAKVPGTSMPISVPNDADRTAIIDYLATLVVPAP